MWQSAVKRVPLTEVGELVESLPGNDRIVTEGVLMALLPAAHPLRDGLQRVLEANFKKYLASPSRRTNQSGGGAKSAVHPVTYRKIALVAGIIATGSARWSHPTLPEFTLSKRILDGGALCG